jgi:CheY-like chemotaxis protein
MDLIMPVKNGYEATQDIRKIEVTNGLQRTYILGISSQVTDGKKLYLIV